MDPGTALVSALLYGKLEGLSPETIFLYGRTGLLHLFSASGFHISAALFLADSCARACGRLIPLRYRKYFRAVLSFALMAFFGAKTEWSSPLVRAFAFTTLLEAAKLLETRPSKWRIFTLSLLVAYFLGRGSDLSFLLSAAGMAGVLWGGGILFGPWVFTLPLVVWHFHVFSLSAPLWNLTLGLAVSFTVLPLAILDLVVVSSGGSSRFLFQLAAFLMGHLHRMLEWFATHLDFSYWVEPRTFFFSAPFLALAIHWFPRRRAWAPASLALAIACLLPAPKLAVLDVGQGDSIFLRLPSGESLLVDGGPPGWKGQDALANRRLERLAVNRIDHVLLTHPDRDHLGGLPSVLARHRAGALWIREDQLPDERLLPLLAAAERAGVGIRFLTEDAVPTGFRCWLPPGRGNESSPFCHARLLGSKSVWLTGDGGFPSEAWLLDRLPLPRADFLKIGHHGSKFSTGEDFVRATGARTALVSVGKNRYGHPARETLRRLERLELRRTDEEGDLLFY